MKGISSVLVFVVIGVFLTSFNAFGETKRIDSSVTRAQLIEFIKEKSDQVVSKAYMLELELVESPFRVVDGTIKEVSIAKPEDVALPTGYSDMEILTAIARKVKPTGSMNRGGSYVLLVGRNLLAEGDSITVTYGNNSYNVYLDEITRDEYVLRLGDARVRKRFEEYGSGSVEPAAK